MLRLLLVASVVPCTLACQPLPAAVPVTVEGVPDVEEGRVDESRVDPRCEEPGCLRGLLHVVDVEREALSALVQPGVEVENGYAVWIAAYRTGDDVSTATVTTPLGAIAPAGGFPIVVNNHGTVGLDDACRLSGTVAGSALAGLFGARGAIGIAPDHPGLGTPGLQPYLIADRTGRSALDAVRAALHVARIVGLESDGRAAIVGLSQGGHAVVAAAAEHADYAPELDVRAFAAAAPASVFFDHWRAGAAVDGPHLIYHALVTEAWAAAAGVDATDAFAAGFDRTLLTRLCTFDPNLSPTPVTPVLDQVVPREAAALFSPSWRAAFERGDLSAFPWLEQGFAQNALRPYTQTAPLALFQGDRDDVVLPLQTRALAEALRAGGVDVELFEVSGAGHLDTAFGFLGVFERGTRESVAWVQAALEP